MLPSLLSPLSLFFSLSLISSTCHFLPRVVGLLGWSSCTSRDRMMVLLLLLLAVGGNGSAPRRGVQGGGRGGLVGPSKKCFICLSVRLHSGECSGSLIQSRTHTRERKSSESFTSFLIKPHSITEHTIM